MTGGGRGKAGPGRGQAQDIINARVWEGVHLRTSDVTGVDLGLSVARWELGQLHHLGI